MNGNTQRAATKKELRAFMNLPDDADLNEYEIAQVSIMAFGYNEDGMFNVRTLGGEDIIPEPPFRIMFPQGAPPILFDWRKANANPN